MESKQENQAHKLIENIRNVVKQHTKENQSQYDKDDWADNTKNERNALRFASNQMDTALWSLLDEDKKNPDNMSLKAQKELIEKAITIVDKHKSKLAPSYSDKLKLHGAKEDHSFNSFKQQLNDFKKSLGNEAENIYKPFK